MAQTLVTGATGFIGSHVTRLLVKRGDEVVVTVRPESDLESLADLAVTAVRANVCDRQAVRRADAGPGSPLVQLAVSHPRVQQG